MGTTKRRDKARALSDREAEILRGKLRELAEKAGSQSALARALKNRIRQPQISALIAGKHAAGYGAARIVADHLGTTLDGMFGKETDEIPERASALEAGRIAGVSKAARGRLRGLKADGKARSAFDWLEMLVRFERDQRDGVAPAAAPSKPR